MASEAARAARNHEARKRLTAGLEALRDRLGIPVPEPQRTMRDPDLQPIVEIERFADFAESVLAALPEDMSAEMLDIKADGEALRAEVDKRDKQIAALKLQIGKLNKQVGELKVDVSS